MITEHSTQRKPTQKGLGEGHKNPSGEDGAGSAGDKGVIGMCAEESDSQCSVAQ